MQKFYNGALPVDKYDDFLKEIRSGGIDEQTKIWQAAFERYLAATGK